MNDSVWNFSLDSGAGPPAGAAASPDWYEMKTFRSENLTVIKSIRPSASKSRARRFCILEPILIVSGPRKPYRSDTLVILSSAAGE